LAKTITVEIPEEFSELCDFDMVAPERVLCGFIADVCGTSFREVAATPEMYRSGCFEDCKQAKIYYDRACGWRGEWVRKNLPQLAEQWQGSWTPAKEGSHDR
jgi:hypothetical protein